MGQGRRTYRLRICARLHRPWRLAIPDRRSENLQSDGPRHQGRCASGWHQRLWWCAHPRGHRLARWLRGDFPTQHPRFRRRTADYSDCWSVSGGCRLLASDDRFHFHGRVDRADVHHRTRCCPLRNGRRCFTRRPRRGCDARNHIRRRTLRRI